MSPAAQDSESPLTSMGPERVSSIYMNRDEETAQSGSGTLASTLENASIDQVQQVDENNSKLANVMGVVAVAGAPYLANPSVNVDKAALDALNNANSQHQVTNAESPVEAWGKGIGISPTPLIEQVPSTPPTPSPTEVVFSPESSIARDVPQVIFYKMYEVNAGGTEAGDKLSRDLQGNINIAIERGVPQDSLASQILTIQGESSSYQVPLVTLSKEHQGHKAGSIVIPLLFQNADSTVSEGIAFFDNPGDGYTPGILPLRSVDENGVVTEYGTPIFSKADQNGEQVPSVLFEFTYDPNTYELRVMSANLHSASVNVNSAQTYNLDLSASDTRLPRDTKLFVIGDENDFKTIPGKNFKLREVIDGNGNRFYVADPLIKTISSDSSGSQDQGPKPPVSEIAPGNIWPMNLQSIESFKSLGVDGIYFREVQIINVTINSTELVDSKGNPLNSATLEFYYNSPKGIKRGSITYNGVVMNIGPSSSMDPVSDYFSDVKPGDYKNLEFVLVPEGSTPDNFIGVGCSNLRNAGVDSETCDFYVSGAHDVEHSSKNELQKLLQDGDNINFNNYAIAVGIDDSAHQ